MPQLIKHGREFVVGDVLAAWPVQGGHPIDRFEPVGPTHLGKPLAARAAVCGGTAITMYDDDHWEWCSFDKAWEYPPRCTRPRGGGA